MANVSFSNLRGPALSLNQVNAISKYNAVTTMHTLPDAATTLTAAMISDWMNTGVMFATPQGSNTRLHDVGADTAPNAASLLQAFGVNNHAASLLEIQRATGVVGGTGYLNIGNSGSTSTYVKFSVQGGAAGATASYALANHSSPSAYIRVSQAGDSVILFDVLKQMK